eukprot:Opistho-2@77310
MMEHHGILKRGPNDPHQKILKWDEDNLQRHEAAADVEYGTMKIDEPKTPYQVYEPATDVDIPLELGDPLQPRSRVGSVEHLDAEDIAQRLGSSSRQRRVSVTSDTDDSDDSDGAHAEDDEDTKRKHAEFAKHRKEHYNMRAALLNKNFDDDEDDAAASKGEVDDLGSPMSE